MTDVEDTEPMAPRTAPTAYIRMVRKSDLESAPADAPEELYALHDENGRPIAIFADRASAIVLAKANSYAPVSVH